MHCNLSVPRQLGHQMAVPGADTNYALLTFDLGVFAPRALTVCPSSTTHTHQYASTDHDGAPSLALSTLAEKLPSGALCLGSAVSVSLVTWLVCHKRAP